MKRVYEAPGLFVDEYAADTMIASNDNTPYDWPAMGGIGSSPKNGNADNNHNCWGCRDIPGFPDPDNRENACMGANIGGVVC